MGMLCILLCLLYLLCFGFPLYIRVDLLLQFLKLAGQVSQRVVGLIIYWSLNRSYCLSFACAIIFPMA